MGPSSPTACPLKLPAEFEEDSRSALALQHPLPFLLVGPAEAKCLLAVCSRWQGRAVTLELAKRILQVSELEVTNHLYSRGCLIFKRPMASSENSSHRLKVKTQWHRSLFLARRMTDITKNVHG
jgi:hypothetical protein